MESFVCDMYILNQFNYFLIEMQDGHIATLQMQTGLQSLRMLPI